MAAVDFDPGEAVRRIQTRLRWIGMRQEELAEKLGITGGTLGAYFTGRRLMLFSGPGSVTATKIATVIGLKVDDLLPNADPGALTTRPHPSK